MVRHKKNFNEKKGLCFGLIRTDYISLFATAQLTFDSWAKFVLKIVSKKYIQPSVNVVSSISKAW